MRKRSNFYIIKKPFYKKRKLWFSILIFILLTYFFYFFFFSSFFQIKKIILPNKEVYFLNDLEKCIKNQIEKELFFLKTKNIFLINTEEIRKRVLTNFPQIAEIYFKKKFPDNLKIDFKEREPIAIFCQKENCFLLDKEGIIFKKEEGENFLKIKKKGEISDPVFGQKIVESELLDKILKIYYHLQDKLNILIDEFFLFSSEKLEIKTKEGWKIYFDPQKDIFWQIKKLEVVLEQEISPEKRKNLDYIDLRFGNLAPYKYR